MLLTVKVIKHEYNFRTKIEDTIKNYIPYGEKQPHEEVWYVFENHSDDCAPSEIELIYIVEKLNNTVTTNFGTFFKFWNLAFKVLNTPVSAVGVHKARWAVWQGGT